MAVLAPSDWQYPRDSTMDVPSSNSKQRPSGANEHSPSHSPPGHGVQPAGFATTQPGPQPYPYPVNQQPQGAWTPSIAAQPFYPNFYQNHQPPAPYSHPQQGAPYFDPANAQLAQWAYHQMMMNAQQFPHLPPPPSHHSPSQRSSSSPPSSSDYFAPNQIPNMFNPFPSGTPPPHRGNPTDHQAPGPNGQYPGFHPYRRPTRQGSQASEPPAPTDWRPANPPYARPDASGSSSSVNSTHSSRQRTNSNQSGKSSHAGPQVNGTARPRNASPASSSSRSSPAAAPPANSSQSRLPPPHNRSPSSSSSNSNATSSRTSTSSSPANSPSPASSTPSQRPVRPSPLSQGTFTASEKRMSRDDSDLAAMLDTPSSSMIRSGGLKGRLRRALSFNAVQALKEEEDDDDDTSIKASALAKKPKSPINIEAAVQKPGGGVISPDSGGDDVSTRAPSTVQTKKKSRAASLFSSRMNGSTDNISLSSTVSSASVMIRKLGSMGKLARRNSLAGITSLFKDKDKDKDKDREGDKKGKKKEKKVANAKGEASEASVSHVTAELDRTSSADWSVGGEMTGLSPAAKLARQHTLKTNAEAAARAKAEKEAVAAAEAARANGASGVPAWERNTTTRQASPVKGGGIRVNEDGTRVFVEEDEDEDSDDGHYTRQAGPSDHMEGWDDDEDWGEGDEDEDVTIRQGLDDVNLDGDDEHEPWATDVRRSIERKRRPAKGILKYAATYDQQVYLQDTPQQNRLRSNSYNAHPGPSADLVPLAGIPDPEHIDGLSRHPSHSSAHGPSASTAPPSLPPLTFDSNAARLSLDSQESPESPASVHHPIPEKATSIFNHPNLNSSAPALSTMSSAAPTLTHRSATAPSKRLAFASNLSVYDTFSATVYDRRSEPATWSRLTPQLAQRIKEELNSYKMEEMEVHAASRIHTQFYV